MVNAPGQGTSNHKRIVLSIRYYVGRRCAFSFLESFRGCFLENSPSGFASASGSGYDSGSG